MVVVSDCRRRVDVEHRRLIVGRLHDRGGRRHDQELAASPDPVDVAVSVHHDDPVRHRIELPNEPVSVDQRRADTFGQVRSPGVDTR